MKTEDPLIGSTTGSPSRAIQYRNKLYICFHIPYSVPIYGGSKFMTNKHTDIQTDKMKTEDPLIGGTTGSPRGAVQYFDYNEYQGEIHLLTVS